MVKSYLVIKMRFTIPFGDNEQDVYITCFGHEDISADAHWGKGSRNVCILHYILSGKGYYNGHEVTAEQGFFISAGSIHEYHSSSSEPWTYFWVVLEGGKAEAVCRKYIKIDKNGIFDYAFKKHITELFNRILGENTRISAARANGYFWWLMSLHEAPQESLGNSYVENAKSYIRLHFHRTLHITEIAETLNISDRYLYNLFIKHDGISPKQYINKIRLEHACDLLKNTHCSITQAASSVGFEDVLTFSRFFKKHTGLSPTAYRSRNSS